MIPTILGPPTIFDFDNVIQLQVPPFTFCILKNSEYIYSFSTFNDAVCILKARYSIDNSIMILSELSHYFGSN